MRPATEPGRPLYPRSPSPKTGPSGIRLGQPGGRGKRGRGDRQGRQGQERKADPLEPPRPAEAARHRVFPALHHASHHRHREHVCSLRQVKQEALQLALKAPRNRRENSVLQVGREGPVAGMLRDLALAPIVEPVCRGHVVCPVKADPRPPVSREVGPSSLAL